MNGFFGVAYRPGGCSFGPWALALLSEAGSMVSRLVFSQGGALWALTRLIQGRGQDRAAVLNLPNATTLPYSSPCCGDPRP